MSNHEEEKQLCQWAEDNGHFRPYAGGTRSGLERIAAGRSQRHTREIKIALRELKELAIQKGWEAKQSFKDETPPLYATNKSH